LKEAIRWVDSLGYNAIDFHVVNFVPTDDEFKQGDDPRSYFRFYEEAAPFDKTQVKCWKASSAPVSLGPLGGHDVLFQGRRVFPIQFLLRHYPVRGQRHGVRKVFRERKGRFLESERRKGWHIQYDAITDERHPFVKEPQLLRRFDLERVRFDLLLPDKILRDMANRLVTVEGALDAYRTERHEFDQHVKNLERALEDAKRYVADLEGGRAELQREIARLAGECEEVKKNLLDSERGRQEAADSAADLAQKYAMLDHEKVAIEAERAALSAALADLENSRLILEKHNSSLEREMALMRRSKSWRWTAPLRRIFRLLGR